MGVGGIGFNGGNTGLDDHEEVSGFSVPRTTIPFYQTGEQVCGNGEEFCIPNGTDEANGARGTSAATAVVAGIAGLVRAAQPSLTADQVRQHLIATSFWSGTGVDNAVDAGAAVTTTPPPPPPPLTVSIFGPNMVPPNEFCTYISSVSGGSGPFTYSWIRNASPAGSGSGVTIFTDVSGYTLKLNVSNSAGQFGTTSIAVTNSPSAPECFF